MHPARPAAPIAPEGPDPQWVPWLAAAVAVVAFHLAYATSAGVLVAIVPFGLLPLATLPTPRRTYYAGLLAGLACVGPQLAFFWGIFGPAALLLWGILAAWMAAALVLIRASRLRWGNHAAWLCTPWIWTGFEYFRSELYPLRFSWLNSGYALAGTPFSGLLPWLGVYGVGFVFWAAAATAWWAPRGWRKAGPFAATALLLAAWATHPAPATPGSPLPHGSRVLRVAGAQVESVPPSEIPAILDRLIAQHPDSELFVLPEYSLGAEPGPDLREWCRTHQRHLVIGGKAPRPEGGYHNTAFVLDPTGTVVFQQAKKVPIQFFDDGVPAPNQALWNSPWGPLGLAICYDLSYTRVMDALVQQGAVALIIPTMDAIAWGAHQHDLHARVAPARAAEYRLPIFRVASSGVSQIVDAQGHVTTQAPFSEDVELLAGTIHPGPPGQRPIDRVLAPAATALTSLILLLLARPQAAPRFPLPPSSPTPASP
jgi:apolipoprotein N-acyltransferase